MRRSLLLGYQSLTGLADTCTGLLLIFAPAQTLRLMGLSAPSAALPFLSYMGVFVLSVGLSCLYGARLITRVTFKQKLEVVWVVTGFTRALVAVFVLAEIYAGAFERGWATVAVTDGAFALFQGIGLWKGWLSNGAA